MKAYTLIELLVTVTIIILVTGGSLAAYLTFNESRQLDIDALNFNSTLNKIRSKAVFLEFNEDCTGFMNIEVMTKEDATGENNSLEYFANCASGATTPVVEKVLITSQFVDQSTLKFLPLSGNLDLQENLTLTIQSTKGSSKSKSITVNQFMGTNNVISNEE